MMLAVDVDDRDGEAFAAGVMDGIEEALLQPKAEG